MNEKMNSYETRVFGVFQFVAGIFGSLIFFVFVYTRHYLISIPFIFFILALIHPIFSKVLVDKEAITIKTNFYRKDVYFYEDIKKLRKEVDIVILLPHWGYEWTIYPPFGVVLEARCFIEAGADVILGCHPHVPQGVERHKNGVIFYSLGNFLFDMCSTGFRNGMIADIMISDKGIEKFQHHFSTINTFFQPMPTSQPERDFMTELIKESTRAITGFDAKRRLDDERIYKEYERQYKYLKIEKVKYLLFSLFREPALIKPILTKTANLLHLLFLRAKGKKVRW